MSRISNIIESFIKELLVESSANYIEIQRNELAKYFECSPSQINYVLSTRFNIDKGYFIESQRGGGGHIRIIKLKVDAEELLQHIIAKQIGKEISKSAAIRIIEFLLESNILTLREANIIKAAMNDTAITSPLNIRDIIRASILKNMLSVIIWK